jgi:flagellar basal-body rod modification protein FlgD
MTPAVSTGSIAAANEQVRTARNPKSELKVEDFINLMVTQLENQNPLEPAKSDQLLSQMSQIGQLQSSQDLQQSLKGLVLQNSLGSAGNMIGKLVEGIDALGQKSTGTVMSVQVKDGNVMLELDSGKQIELARVSQITQAPTPTTTGTPVAG